MKTLYLDCGMGAAGDMLTAALFDILPKKQKTDFVNKMNTLGIEEVSFSIDRISKCGVMGSHVTVKVHGEEEHSHDFHGADAHSCDFHNGEEHSHEHNVHQHDHSNLESVNRIVDLLPVSEKVKSDVKNVYTIIAEAESHVHGVTVEEIHFHEVGNKDAIIDITAVCILMDMISPDKVISSPVHVGSGKVRCAHGILPVPAPATAQILMGIPTYSGEIKGELCTPTGAALLKYFVNEFGSMPVLKTEAIGYGMGNKDFPVANCVRVFLGETDNQEDTILNLSCNVDDMTPEEIGFAMERLFDAGAKDVFVMPVTMKKCRPGHVINVICKPELKDKMVDTIMKYTSTIGIRETVCKRNVLKRQFEEVNTSLGTVRKKISTGYGVTREKYEFDDLAMIARENDMSISDVKKIILGTES